MTHEEKNHEHKNHTASAPEQTNQEQTNQQDVPTSEETATAEETCNKTQDDALAKVLAEKDAAVDKYVRLMADFENYKKRTQKEFLDLTQTASKSVILAMLEVLDDATRAEVQMQKAENVEAVKEGVILVFTKLRTRLEKLGVKKMDALNTPFDTSLHEAVTEFPVADEAKKNKVIEVVEEGYFLHGKLIRFAKVVVGK